MVKDDDGDNDKPITETKKTGGDDDLTNRFKYKVNALMGAFDPLDQAKDNENVDGNIFNAMLTFPTEYTFHVVGKTSSDSALQENFVTAAKSALGGLVNELTQCVVTPRGKSFTKVSMTASVESAETIVAVYEKLANVPSSVMQF